MMTFTFAVCVYNAGVRHACICLCIYVSVCMYIDASENA